MIKDENHYSFIWGAIAIILLIGLSQAVTISSSTLGKEIGSMISGPASKVQTFTFIGHGEQIVEIFNGSGQIADSMNISLSSQIEGSINLSGRRIWIHGALLQTGQDNNTLLESELYILNSTVWMKIGDIWAGLKLPHPEQLWIPEANFSMIEDMLGNSRITLIGFEDIADDHCYKVRVMPGSLQAGGLYPNTLFKQQIVPLAYPISISKGGALNLAGIGNASKIKNNEINSDELDWMLWISRSDHLIKKSQMRTKVRITPEMIGLPATDMGPSEMELKLYSTILFSDYNKQITITGPADI